VGLTHRWRVRPRRASINILITCFKNISKLDKGYTIYVHNLGGFDAIFILKTLASLHGKFNILMDGTKDTISLSIKNHCVIKDSYRILNGSLATLSKIFNVPVQKSQFDHSKVTLNNLADIRSELIEYLNKDLISLVDVMIAATLNIFKIYQVDVSETYSASSLAMKIFRTNF